MAALCSRCGHYIFVLWLLLLSIFFFLLAYSQLSQIGCLPYFHRWCGLIANLGYRSETCCTQLTEKYRTQKIAKNSPSGHHCSTLLGHIFVTKARINNRKTNLLNSHILPTCPHNMVNFGPLAAVIRWRVWGTPANFKGFCILAVLLHGTVVVGVSQTLQHWTEGATYIWQGGHILVYLFCQMIAVQCDCMEIDSVLAVSSVRLCCVVSGLSHHTSVILH